MTFIIDTLIIEFLMFWMPIITCYIGYFEIKYLMHWVFPVILKLW